MDGAPFTIMDAPVPGLDSVAEGGVRLPSGFRLDASGLWYQPPPRSDGTEPDPVWVAGPFRIVATTCDDAHHGHGLLLEWHDRTGHHHHWAMPKRMVHADGNAIAAELEDAGLSCGTSRAAHEHLKHCLGAAQVNRRFQCVDRAGWHGASYVLPDGRVFGADTDGLVMQTEHVATGVAYAARGMLDEWRDRVARYAIGNELLTLSMSCAFAAPLLDVTGEPSGGLHFCGGSQTGKTTLLRCAASVWGPGDDTGQLRSWRVTTNGLEAVAAETSDGLLILDEIGQANPHELGDVIYMLANQSGKARANRAGGARRNKTWRTLFLSSGEVTLAAKLAEAGLRTHAGQDVRMIGLSADAGASMGVWRTLHNMPTPAAQTDHLRAASRTYCGSAGPAYLESLARERADDAHALTVTLRSIRERFLATTLPDDADGQVRSACARFALIAAAGELATAYGITGWPPNEAFGAAAACFRWWLDARGGGGAAEDMRAVEAVRAFVAIHGASRFERADDNAPDDQRIINRAGFRRRTNEGQEYLILPSVWRDEVCRGLDAGRVARALVAHGLLRRDGDGRHLTAVVRLSNHGRIRVYRVLASILGDGGEEAADAE